MEAETPMRRPTLEVEEGRTSQILGKGEDENYLRNRSAGEKA